jgi:hypothetical protein
MASGNLDGANAEGKVDRFADAANTGATEARRRTSAGKRARTYGWGAFGAGRRCVSR